MAKKSSTTRTGSSSTSVAEAVLEAERRRLDGLLDRRRLWLVIGLLDTEQLGQLAALVHLCDDVAAADQLAVHEQLRDRRPVRDRRELLADARVGEDVHRRVAHVERVEHRRGAHREAT